MYFSANNDGDLYEIYNAICVQVSFKNAKIREINYFLFFRVLPQRWVNFLDPILYPTCPVKIPEPENKKEVEEEKKGIYLNLKTYK